jgi:hypothetical protein
MISIPFGLSVHHFISSVGADAGFASLIGLALLVLLYFAHARETATLRSRADDAGLRVQELEAQVAELADQVAAIPAEISVRAASPRAAAAYAGSQERLASGVAPDAAGAGRGGSFPPFAPAGVGAPALAAATRLIPLPDFPVAEPEPVSAAVSGESNGSGHVPVGAATVQRPVAAPPGAGVGGPRVPAGPGRAGGAPGRPLAAPGRSGAGGGRPGAGQTRGGAGRPVMPMRPAPRRSRKGRVLAALAVAAVGAAAVVAAVLLLSNRGNNSQAAGRSSVASSLTSRRTASKAATAAVRPSTVTVSVLNGTDVSGLAGRVLQQLAGDGYRAGVHENASDQTQTTSVVAYMTPADRADALAVASSLKLSRAAVQAINPSTKAIACPPNQACTSAVVVTAGQDLAAQ